MGLVGAQGRRCRWRDAQEAKWTGCRPYRFGMGKTRGGPEMVSCPCDGDLGERTGLRGDAKTGLEHGGCEGLKIHRG